MYKYPFKITLLCSEKLTDEQQSDFSEALFTLGIEGGAETGEIIFAVTECPEDNDPKAIVKEEFVELMLNGGYDKEFIGEVLEEHNIK